MEKELSILLLLSLFFLTGCSAGGGDQGDNSTNSSGIIPVNLGTEGLIPKEQCELRGIENRVLVLETRFCGACKKAKPILQELEA